MYIAKLINGKDYGVLGKLFLEGQEQEVDKKTFAYLKDNPQFEVKEVKDRDDKKDDGASDGTVKE